MVPPFYFRPRGNGSRVRLCPHRASVPDLKNKNRERVR